MHSIDIAVGSKKAHSCAHSLNVCALKLILIWYGDPLLEEGSKSKSDCSLVLKPSLDGRFPISSVCCGSVACVMVETLPNAFKKSLFLAIFRPDGDANAATP